MAVSGASQPDDDLMAVRSIKRWALLIAGSDSYLDCVSKVNGKLTLRPVPRTMASYSSSMLGDEI